MTSSPLLVFLALATASGGVRPDLCEGEYFRSHPVATVDYLGFFASRDAAAAAAAEIDVQRFVVELREAAVGGMWSLKATYRSLPDGAAFAKDRVAMAEIGKTHGADGFGPGCAGEVVRGRE